MSKLRFATALALATLLGGALAAEDKKEEKKPTKRQATAEGKIKSIDAKARTITIYRPFDPNFKEATIAFGPDATVFIDGKEAKFENVPVGGEARVSGGTVQGSRVTDATELAVIGTSERAVVRKASGDTLTYKPDFPPGSKPPPDKTVKLAADGKATLGGKEIKLSELKPGDKIVIRFTADGSAAFRIGKEVPLKKK